MSVPAAKPYQMVPASTVVNVNISTPLDVNDGAVPPAQSTELGQLTVWLPPLVKINVNEQALPVAEGLENVKVFVLVSTVAVTTLPAVTSISCVPPPVPPIMARIE